ncbi:MULTISPECIES: DCL family protein [Aeromonas]|uniref:DCL family protein n=1 Tax=Aeromonas TaxID=642 RepID=UPI00244510E9|nr:MULTISPECIES: DCL family protein [Aeromonas]HEG4446471.1 DCL family protein [Aeromonas hydrophila]
MPAKPICLGPMHFDRRGDAVAYLKDMLHRYDLGDRVSKEDSVVLRAALENHPNAALKIGPGIASFSVRSADFGTKCFWVNRTDGTTEKFSITGSIHSS